MAESIGTAAVRIIGDGDGLRDDVIDAIDDLGKDIEKSGDRHGKKFGKGFTHGLREQLRDFDHTADAIGRLFGRGSRNNFLNFFGSIITNVLKTVARLANALLGLGEVFTKVFTAGIEFVADFRKQLAQGATAAEAFAFALGESGLAGVLSTVATGGLNLVAGLVVLGSALGLAALSAGALISALILLSGVIIALAASIEAALIAALASLGPLLIAIAPVIAGIVASVQMFKDASDELKPSIRAINKEASSLWKTFKDRALRNAVPLIEKVADSMKDLRPAIAGAGDGFRNFAKAIVDSVTGPEFKAFNDAFAKFLPAAMRKLGIIVGNVFEGLGGLLRASIPLANQLLGWLVGITDNFSKFTNSQEGQQRIKDFLKEAADSAKAVGDFIGQAAGLVQDFLNQGRDTGDSIFTSMADALGRVRDYLRDNPDALKDFFADAKDFASALGHAIEDIVSAIDRIDTEKTRKFADGLIVGLGAVVTVAGEVIHFFELITEVVSVLAQAVFDQFAAVAKAALGQMAAVAQAVADGASHIPGPIGKALSAAAGSFAGYANSAIDDIDDVGRKFGLVEDDIAKSNPSFGIDTSAAEAKLTFIGRLAEQIQQAIRNANADAVAAGAQSGGTNTGSTGGNTGGAQDPERTTGTNRRTAPVVIQVQTPTTDPRAVAAETVNRLVALGY